MASLIDKVTAERSRGKCGNEPFGCGETSLARGRGAANQPKALGCPPRAPAGCAVLQASEWPGWWAWFMGEVRLKAVFKRGGPSDLGLPQRGGYCDGWPR